MDKETKRALQNMLEIIREQRIEIRTLQQGADPTTQRYSDRLAERIERVAKEISERESFEIDWRRLCDRHYAIRS
jgi:hypothetical protein